jgi:hypothetical protein
MYLKNVKRGSVQFVEGERDHFVIKFTTTSTDYDLITDTNIRAALEEFLSSSQINEGVYLSFSILVKTPTQVKINDRSFYDDFINDVVFDHQDLITSIKIKDTSIDGTFECWINEVKE